MILDAPNFILFAISALLALIPLLVVLKVPLPGNADHAVYVALVAYAILAASVVF